MGLIYILPGILGSELYTEHEPSGLLWVNYGRLVVGEIGRLRLDVDGLSPGPPDGLDCFAGAPLPAYYGFAQSSLFQQLKSRNYDVQPWGYDWRKDILSEGVELANNIRFRSRLGGPVTIVGHSQGGLVARAAWYELQRTSETRLIRRLITLGTPHQGSYAIVQLLSLSDPRLSQMSDLTVYAAALVNAFLRFPWNKPWTLAELAALAATWPAVYQLFPLVSPTTLDYDPERFLLFRPASWPTERGISPAWLKSSATTFRQFLLDSRSMPSGDVLTTVTSRAFETAEKLRGVDRIGYPDIELGYDLGDGTVTAESAVIAASKRYIVDVGHADLFNTVVASGDLAEWIIEERSPPDPTALPVQLSPVIYNHLQGPPIPSPPPGSAFTGPPAKT